ncbi:MAG: DUF4386 domain-containing protein [bacterium]|nr:DUF4386 domain-containing protein [bacterium]MBK9471952.1 DUF4386 domain-containing protein [bacterium]
MTPTKKDARLAGLLYLPVVFLGPFVLLYVPGRIFAPGDASATVANLLAHESLFRANIVIGMVSQLFFVASVLALYQLLRDVGRRLAGIMVILILLVAPLAIAGAATQVATLKLLHDPQFLAGFTGAQRDSLVMLLLEFDRHGTLAAELYWGLWLLPLGVLVHRSRFLPRFLGIWLVANGVAYVVLSLVGILWPSASGMLFKIAMPLMFGEAVLALWLVVVGGRFGAVQREAGQGEA